MPGVAEEQNDDLELEHAGQEEHNDDLNVIDGEVLNEDEEQVEAEKARARRMGWAPEDEFRGDPGRWVDYDVFLQRGEEKLPILQERLRKQDETIARQNKEIKQVIRNQGKFERETRERVRGEFEERKRTAVGEADTDAFDQVTREQQEWEEKNQAPAAAPAEGDEKPKDPNFIPWQEKNPWYGTNEEMSVYAESMMPFVQRTRPEVMGTPQFYEVIEKLVRKQYPEHFENTNRTRRNTVHGGSGPAGGSGKRKTYADLSAAAKKKCDEYVDAGYIADKAEYVREYFSEENE